MDHMLYDTEFTTFIFTLHAIMSSMGLVFGIYYLCKFNWEKVGICLILFLMPLNYICSVLEFHV